jgi:hypothetical protein
MKKSTPLLTVVALCMFLALANVHLTSCTKTDTVTDTTVLTIHDTTIVKDTVRPGPSTLSLLTGKQWEVDSVFDNYTGPGTGTLVYVRGGSGNLINLDSYFTTFTIDGDLWQVEGGTYFLSKWNFVNTDSALYKVVSPVYGTDYGRILNLSADTLNVYDSTAHARDVEILAP